MRLMVSGGGTGGHIYPALALLEEVKKQEPDSEVLYVGSKRGMEMNIVPSAKVPFESISTRYFEKSLISWYSVKTVGLFIKSLFEARKIIKKFKPDVIVGTGGYASGAVLFVAVLMKIPTAIHEQNMMAGFTNKFLGRFVNKIAISFENSGKEFPKDKVELVGNPRATQIVNQNQSDVNLEQFKLKNDKPTVLIFSGSLGAPKINNTVVDMMHSFSQRNYQIIFVTGKSSYQEIDEKIDHKIDNVAILPYLNIASVLSKMSVVVCRAGATSISELTALGIPSILIPSPFAAHDHQTQNAMSLVNAGGAILIKESELTDNKLIDNLDKLMNDNTLRESMVERSKKVGNPDAAYKFYKLLKSIQK